MKVLVVTDQINVIGIFSNEGNKGILEKGWFRHHNIDVNGNSTALFIGNEQLWGLYNLTK